MRQSSSWQIPLYAGTLFLAAMLLFGLQPMVVRMILPALGGAPAVWTTAQVFFQALLLTGYLYAHFLARMRNPGQALLLHVAVLGLALTLMPIGFPARWQPDVDASPALALIGVLVVHVGAPFFAIASTAPLLQFWFSHSGHAHAANPYFLYSASNLGGLAALISYPFLVEPLLGLRDQSALWGAGFALLATLVLAAGASVLRAAPVAAPGAALRPYPPPSARQRAHWTLLAFVPSSLMLAVTLHVSTDIAAMPFLWLLPLALYLLTWVISFARHPLLPHRRVLQLQPLAIVLLVLAFATQHLALAFTVHLGAFFLCALMCHGELARTRPAVGQLTEFYLWLSLGGLLGGVFNALLAPQLFDAVWEYPVVVVLAVLLRPAAGADTRVARDLAAAALLALLFYCARAVLDSLRWADIAMALLGVSLGIGIVFWTMREQRLRFALATAALLIAGQASTDHSQVLAQTRSFFGVHRLVLESSGRYIMMTHGNTVHGLQRRHEDGRPVPVAYYIASGPFGRVLQRLNERAPRASIGIVGMGAAAITCLAAPTQRLTYFEIDSSVIDLASDARYLHYMQRCGGNARIVLGDGRRRLERTAPGSFDMLVLDAFSSDAIPVHLLTREALRSYARKLTAGGVMMIHLSNRHLDLAPVVAATARSAGLIYRVQDSRPQDRTTEYWPSTWMLVGTRMSALQPFLDTGQWHETTGATQPWTDDYSDISAAIRWDSLW